LAPGRHPTLATCPQLLVKWWAEYPAELLEGRVVKPLQKYLTDELYATKKLTIRWVGGGGGGRRREPAGGALLPQLGRQLGRMPAVRKKRLCWLRCLSPAVAAACPAPRSVMNVIKVLAKVEEANQLGRQLPPEAFYNELIRRADRLQGQTTRPAARQPPAQPGQPAELAAGQRPCPRPPHPHHALHPALHSPFPCCSEKLDVLDHYVAWRQTHDMPQHASGTDGPFSFCSYPFLLNPRAKSKLLHTEARIQMDQTVAQSRLEQQAGGGGSNSARGGRRPEEDECVVPNEKARISAALRSGAAEGGTVPRGGGPPHGGGGRRRDRQGGLRWLFNSLRASEGAGGGSSLQDDERRMMGRHMNGTSEGGRPSLWKQGSLNLPTPDDSGFPATHPDMCILRIRRNHLLEVRTAARLLSPGARR
jgi:hypothetical protein